jgi:hypothetical protein
MCFNFAPNCLQKRKKWALWWAMTSEKWGIEELLHEFIKAYWDKTAAAIAVALLQIPTLH